MFVCLLMIYDANTMHQSHVTHLMTINLFLSLIEKSINTLFFAGRKKKSLSFGPEHEQRMNAKKLQGNRFQHLSLFLDRWTTVLPPLPFFIVIYKDFKEKSEVFKKIIAKKQKKLRTFIRICQKRLRPWTSTLNAIGKKHFLKL